MKQHLSLRLCAAIIALAFASATSTALAQQQAVTVGKGSYADNPPIKDNKFAEKYNKTPFIHPSQEGRPVPTNDWWTDLIMHGPGGRLWANPALVKFDDYGVMVSYPGGWNTGRGEKGSGGNVSTPLGVRLAGSSVKTS